MTLLGDPRRTEVDQFTIRLLVGVAAFFLPYIELGLAWLTGNPLDSISASYTLDSSSRDLFVGFVF